MNVNKYTKI